MQAPRTADPGSEGGRPGAANALGGEPSAYLRQHAQNPVHWRPFGDEAFAFAAARDVPVFLSIGYAACHWCHVMAHESFEDQATADYLNANFVAVKVDREERPDVDAVYMAATQSICGEGGWPMSLFLTPDGLAFHAGTYFPPEPVPGRPSFRQVLEAVREAWLERRDAVELNARTLAQGMADAQQTAAVLVSGPPELIDARLLPEAVQSLVRSEDHNDGGFGGAPKFPPSAVLEFLIRHAAAGSDTADAARDMAGRTLAAMSRSALFDQLDGGFARYSVTRDWSVPHFEKMLYDNAQLLRVYVHWVRLGGNEMYPASEAAEVAGRTADWMLDSLGLTEPEPEPGPEPDGDGDGAPGAPAGPVALASSLDADSEVDGEHHEGASYLWTVDELERLLGSADGAAVAGMMNVGLHGTVSRFGSPLHPGRALGAVESALLDGARPRLQAARSTRAQPARDDKVVAGWNGLAVAALAEAGAVLDRPGLVEASERIARHLERVHWNPESTDAAGELMRVSHSGTSRGIGGLLEDYAFCAEGLLALYSVTGRAHWYGFAESVVIAACRRFVVDGRLADSAGESAQVFNAQGQQPGLDPFDGATPSGAAAFAGVLLSYAALSGSTNHRIMAGNILALLLPPIASRAPRVAGWLLATAQAALAGPVEAAVVGAGSPEKTALHRALLMSGSPGLVIALEPDGGRTVPQEPALPLPPPSPLPLPEARLASGPAVPLLAGRHPAADGSPLVYLCRDMVCERPVDTVPELLERLAGMTG